MFGFTHKGSLGDRPGRPVQATRPSDQFGHHSEARQLEEEQITWNKKAGEEKGEAESLKHDVRGMKAIQVNDQRQERREEERRGKRDTVYTWRSLPAFPFC
jgi:hypothetical protein